MSITYEQIAKVSNSLKLTPIKGKEYATVNQRVKAFRMLYPEGSIETFISHYEEGLIIMQATVKDENGKILAAGTSYEREGSSMINKTSFIENCETSAVGRALGFLGIGIEAGMASADEMTTALEKQGQIQSNEPIPYTDSAKTKAVPDYQSSIGERLVYERKPKKALNMSAQCQKCLKSIEPTLNKKTGDLMTVQDIVEYSKRLTGGSIYCPDCLKKELKDGRNA